MGEDSLKEDFGVIQYNEYPSGDVFMGVVEGYSKNKPRFVGVDSGVWEDIWMEKSRLKGIDYVHCQGRFIKEIRFSEQVEEIKEDVRDLLKSYNDSSINYNQLISDPVFESRTNVLENIISNY